MASVGNASLIKANGNQVAWLCGKFVQVVYSVSLSHR